MDAQNLKIEKIVASDKHFPDVFFVFDVQNNKSLSPALKNITKLLIRLFFYKTQVFSKFLKITKLWIVAELV